MSCTLLAGRPVFCTPQEAPHAANNRRHQLVPAPTDKSAAAVAWTGLLALLLNIDVLAELVSIGTLYVFMSVCCGVLFRRYHPPGSPRGANILGRIGAVAAAAAGKPSTQLQ